MVVCRQLLMMISWLLFTEVCLSRFLHDDVVEDGGEDADEDEDAENEVLLFYHGYPSASGPQTMILSWEDCRSL